MPLKAHDLCLEHPLALLESSTFLPSSIEQSFKIADAILYVLEMVRSLAQLNFKTVAVSFLLVELSLDTGSIAIPVLKSACSGCVVIRSVPQPSRVLCRPLRRHVDVLLLRVVKTY